MSVVSYSGERIILREKQLSRSDFEKVGKKENLGETFFHTTYKENYEMDCENLTYKVENAVEVAEPTLNNPFPQIFDSFSSDQRINDLTFIKTEHSALSSTFLSQAHNDSYPQYLNNYNPIVCIRGSDPFDSCLKGRNTCEVRVKFLSGNDSEMLDSPINSRIVPTCQRLRELTDGTTTNERKRPRNNVKKNHKNSSSQNAKTHTKELNSKKRFKSVLEKPLICTICGAKYSYEIPFTRHVSKHTNTFQCNLCPRSFPSQRSLANHLRSHERTRGKQVKRPSQQTHK